MIFRRGLSGAARNEVAGQINAATRAQYLVLMNNGVTSYVCIIMILNQIISDSNAALGALSGKN